MTVGVPAHWLPGHALLEELDAAALAVDATGEVRRSNSAADRTYAGPDGVMSGRRLASIFGEGDRTALAAVVRQVLDGDPWQGRVELLRADGSTHDAGVSCTPLHEGDRVRGLLCLIVDSSAEGRRLRDARLLEERLTRIARVTGELGRAETVEDVTQIVTTHFADAVGASIAGLLVRESESSFRLIGLRGGRTGDREHWAHVSVEDRTVIRDVARTGRRVQVSTPELHERYPDMLDRGHRSVLALPLNVAGRTIGVISLSFPGVRVVDAAEMEFLEILADNCAQALQRIEAQSSATIAAERLAFLADASVELARSLDYEVTLAKVAQLVVPTFADWCAIDVVEDGRLHRLAVAHVDPAKVQLARELEERYPSNPDAPRGTWHVLRTGRSDLIPEITDEMLVAGATDGEHLRIARDLQLRSALVVPLTARGKVRGVITWVAAESDRRYTEDDLAFAEDLARRAAVAIDNAELHSHTLAAAVRLQEAVLPDRMPEVPGWEVASYYDPSGRTDVGGDFYDAVPLLDGRMVLFVGDVMGRGVEAAAAMAQMRAAVRAYCAVDPSPAAVLGKLDRMFAQFPSEQLVTLAYLVVDPSRGELVVANAGHPAPVLLRGDGSTEQLPDADGSPLAVLVQDRREQRIRVRAGDVVLLFTDGLIERRGEDLDIGQARVLDLLPTLAGDDLAGRLQSLVVALRDPSRDDDVAAVAVRVATADPA
ncbi:SpoIIE family protein phosphatase [Nocardioides guangzhouensis]|uniref:SpoIIE family protein phosphatase n=1 Tax=Nocardioides guangzhouensis TaxID=2497878 RepID=UPI0014385450|nr:SpoIIE family protein phosphatase [Nocardioides guangzhouensis]